MPPTRVLSAFVLASSLACASLPLSALRSEVKKSSGERAPGGLRVMTFNIQSGRGGLERVAEVIRSAAPDVVALQEVDRSSSRAMGVDQPVALAEQTGLPYHAHFRTKDMHGGAYGIALLSRYPLETVAQQALPVPEGSEPRTVAHVVVRVGGREVSIYVTHLIRQPFNEEVRTRESVAILRWMEKDPRPKLLLGDMNDVPGSRAVRLLKRELLDVLEAKGQGGQGTYPLPLLGPLRLDYVLACHHFQTLRSVVLKVEASDHYPVVADLALSEEEHVAGEVPVPVLPEEPTQQASSTGS